MISPFDDPDGMFHVLVNAENQHSLWPARLLVPDGWASRHGPAGRQDCLDHIDQCWTDLRPASLAARMTETVPAPAARPSLRRPPTDP
jgi:MbtH protein